MQENPSLVDEITEKIRTEISLGTYKPGEKLVTSKIARDLGVSRTPIIAAINRLEAEGLALNIPNRGTIVKKMTLKEILDMLDARKMIELYSVDLAIKNKDYYPELLKKMEDNAEIFKEIGDTDYGKLNVAENIFHSSFIELTGNKQLVRLYNMNWGVGSAMYLYAHASLSLSIQEKSILQHDDLINTLKEGDGEKLKILFTEHLDTTYSVIQYMYSMNLLDDKDTIVYR